MISRYNILLAEPDHRERSLMARSLEDCGYHLTLAHDGADALAKFKDGVFQMVVSAFELPDMSGHDFLAQVMDADENAHVLFLAGEPSVQDAVETIKNGALDFLIKPVDQGRLRLYAESVFEKNRTGKSESGGKSECIRIVTCDPGMEKLIALVDRIADSRASVLIQGESGTGKELFARYIHEKSGRSDRPFVAVNCAALPESLLESELFGHEKGAFTGASALKPGKFELADGGTLLLDEITEMQYHLQSKLLRVIQEKEVDRVGGSRPVRVDVRVLATTNRDVKAAIEKGEFREDLYYRLNVIPVKIPPLRDRRDDIRVLAEYFVGKYNEIDGRSVKGLTKEAVDRIVSLPFRGNVREMENLVQRAVLLSDGEMIRPEDLMLEGDDAAVSPPEAGKTAVSEDIFAGPLKEVEKKMIFHTLDKTGGNRTHAASILGISVRTLRNKLNEYKEKMEEF